MGGHTFSETVLVFSFPLRWLVSPFHWGNVFLSFNCFFLLFGFAKVSFFSLLQKKLLIFTTLIFNLQKISVERKQPSWFQSKDL